MIVFNLGRRRLGKSTLASWQLRQQPIQIIFDPRRQFFTDVAVHDLVGERDVFDEQLKLGRVVIQPDDAEVAIAQLADIVTAMLAANDRIKLAVLIDEAGMVKKELHQRAWMWLFRTSPNNVVFVLTAHRITDVMPDIRSIADIWCLFRTSHVSDLDAIEDHCGKKVREEVQHLDVYTFISWDDRVGEESFHLDPKRWYVPIGNTERVAPLDVLPEGSGPKRQPQRNLLDS